ncbi:MAG: 16S rRNA (uracil(1498)-N(3))-methyltransferase [Ruminococcus sp.]|nr:16S rRNA (uracil(1498)-N(3))-methyltransferase [Ruminococcus sp.]
MPRFFLEHINPENIRITGEDAHHIGRSLRMRTGEELTVCANGTDYHCRITAITPDEVLLTALSSELCAAEPTVHVTLYQAVPKSDKLSQIIQKSVELGAVRIVPVLTRRCVARPDKKDFDKKLSRLQKIAESAAKQSGRGIIPEVAPLYTWQEALNEMTRADRALLFYEEGGMRFSEVPLEGCKEIAIFIGSEGGLDPEEAEAAKAAGILPVWLGSRILRCETAPLTAISVLMYLTGNL